MADPRLSPSGIFTPVPAPSGPPLTMGFFDVLGNLTGSPRIALNAALTELTFSNDAAVPQAQIRRTDGRAWFAELHVGSAGGPRLFAVGGDPNGVVVANLGDLALSTAGGFGLTLWTKEVGGNGTDFGWVPSVSLTPPVTPGQDGFAAFGSGGDLSYSAGLRFPGGTPLFFVSPKIDNSNGYTVIGFDPPVAPAGPPFFGAGNGVQFQGQHAAAGSGLSGGDSGVQGGNSDGAATGATGFVQPGTGGTPGVAELRNSAGAARVAAGGANDGVAFFGGVPEAQITVVGLKGGNTALASLLSALATYGLIVDGTGP